MRSAVRVLALLALLSGATTGAEAQGLKSGTWSGTGAGPGGEAFDITFEVRNDGDSLSIALIAPDGESFPLSQIRLEEGKLLFQWEPGVVVNCVLVPGEGGSFSGPCTDEEGGTGTLTMVPPQG